MPAESDWKGRRVGVIGVPGKWSTEALADALAERTGYRRVIDMADVALDLATGVCRHGDEELTALDALIVKKIGEEYRPDLLDRLEVLRFVAEQGVPVFSRPLSMIRLLDRLSCTVTLRRGRIPMPTTTITEHVGEAAATVRRYGAAVFKPLYSTKARGMTILEASDGELEGKIEAFKAAGNPVMYIQERLEMPGRDLGVVFLGGRYLGTYARVASGESWNTTIRSGGHYERHEPSGEVLEVARRAQELFDLDFTSVDVVELPDGPVVFEVSAFGGFRGCKEGLGIDAAALYAEHVLGWLDGHGGGAR